MIFEKDQWTIYADIIGGRCARIRYLKKGDWTDEQLRTLLENNRENKSWIRDSASSKLIKKWNRSDGGFAKWEFAGSMEFVSEAYLKVKEEKERKEQDESRKKPDL
ncbi:hypothetical protein [Nibricoccus sp. IMCC34717]|uniref:hypothetical protein n=1 Tax=Nibricoccus sp. IMCC34717 TaxID=3034021 RepID=UPI00384E99D3